MPTTPIRRAVTARASDKVCPENFKDPVARGRGKCQKAALLQAAQLRNSDLLISALCCAVTCGTISLPMAELAGDSTPQFMEALSRLNLVSWREEVLCEGDSMPTIPDMGLQE